MVGAVLEGLSLADTKTEDGAGEPRMGRTIGILERLILLTLILLDQWGALGLILTAKSVARFKELEDRRFSEYYLIGTLSSSLVAIATGLLVRLLV